MNFKNNLCKLMDGIMRDCSELEYNVRSEPGSGGLVCLVTIGYKNKKLNTFCVRRRDLDDYPYKVESDLRREIDFLSKNLNGNDSSR